MNETRFYSAEEAEAAFYRAFERRDLDAMMAVWADEASIVCVHPGGPMLIGREAVRASWEQILAGGGAMSFAVQEVRREIRDRLAVHVVQEHIRAGDERPGPPVLVTNVYRLTDHGWRMILHHASPSPRPARPKGMVH
jgi:uncharacterized protein (TIGR02246 family)